MTNEESLCLKARNLSHDLLVAAIREEPRTVRERFFLDMAAKFIDKAKKKDFEGLESLFKEIGAT